MCKRLPAPKVKEWGKGNTVSLSFMLTPPIPLPPSLECTDVYDFDCGNCYKVDVE